MGSEADSKIYQFHSSNENESIFTFPRMRNRDWVLRNSHTGYFMLFHEKCHPRDSGHIMYGKWEWDFIKNRPVAIYYPWVNTYFRNSRMRETHWNVTKCCAYFGKPRNSPMTIQRNTRQHRMETIQVDWMKWWLCRAIDIRSAKRIKFELHMIDWSKRM